MLECSFVIFQGRKRVGEKGTMNVVIKVSSSLNYVEKLKTFLNRPHTATM